MLELLKLKRILLGQYTLGTINNSCFYDDSRRVLPILESLKQAKYDNKVSEYTKSISPKRIYNRHRGVK